MPICSHGNKCRVRPVRAEQPQRAFDNGEKKPFKTCLTCRAHFRQFGPKREGAVRAAKEADEKKRQARIGRWLCLVLNEEE